MVLQIFLQKCFWSTTVFVKASITDVWQGPKYAIEVNNSAMQMFYKD